MDDEPITTIPPNVAKVNRCSNRNGIKNPNSCWLHISNIRENKKTVDLLNDGFLK
jgi:hypothetical protein